MRLPFPKRIPFLSPRNQTAVFAFYGPSGTGKSYRAKFVAQKFKVKALIDDGLLIQGDRILAGKSAKLEKSYMGAVRVALFDDKEHRDSVAKAIRKNRIRRLLVLGTSEKMIRKITTRLQLPEPLKFVRIDEVATAEEMDEARRSRQIEGKHVIPVHSHEIRRNSYSRIFVDSIRVALTRRRWLSRFLKFLPEEKPAAGGREFEKSIVRPAFSVQERKRISHAMLAFMAAKWTAEFGGGIRLKRLSVRNGASGYTLALTADVPSGGQLAEAMGRARDFIVRNIEKESGVFVEELYFEVDKILK